MNCSKVNNLISAYIDGELTGDEQILVRRHLRDCTTCTEEYESLMATKRLIASFAARLPDSSLETKILSALNEMPDCQTWRDSVRSWWGSLPELQKLKTAGALAFCKCINSSNDVFRYKTAPDASRRFGTRDRIECLHSGFGQQS